MSGIKVRGGTCERRTVFRGEHIQSGGLPCHRDAVGTFDIYIHGSREAVMALCDECAEFYRQMDIITRVVKTSDEIEYMGDVT